MNRDTIREALREARDTCQLVSAKRQMALIDAALAELDAPQPNTLPSQRETLMRAHDALLVDGQPPPNFGRLKDQVADAIMLAAEHGRQYGRMEPSNAGSPVNPECRRCGFLKDRHRTENEAYHSECTLEDFSPVNPPALSEGDRGSGEQGVFVDELLNRISGCIGLINSGPQQNAVQAWWREILPVLRANFPRCVQSRVLPQEPASGPVAAGRK
jgi:hypothetical protein